MLEALSRTVVLVSCIQLLVCGQFHGNRGKGTEVSGGEGEGDGAYSEDLSLVDAEQDEIRHFDNPEDFKDRRELGYYGDTDDFRDRGDFEDQDNLREIEITLHRFFSNEVPSDLTEDAETLHSFKRTIDKEAEEEEEDLRRYLNEWVVHLQGGHELAERAIRDLGYEFHGKVGGFTDVYEVSHKYGHQIRKKRETAEITRHIQTHNNVTWAEQQYVLRRVKRFSSVGQEQTRTTEDEMIDEFEASSNRTQMAHWMENLYNDPMWSKQWYMFDTRTSDSLPELNLEVLEVWKQNITGRGVKVAVIDDGLEWKHPDIVNNYDPSISWDVIDNDSDPTPTYDARDFNSHGTSCAGEIAMRPNNGVCGVGVAYGANIGGVRLLDGFVTDKIEAQSIMIILDNADIYSSSWGPKDNGQTLEGPGTLMKMALEEGTKRGRGGKGAIFIWAGGNGGNEGDNCDCDGYTSSIYTISIGSASQTGQSPFYAEQCSSTVATTYSSGAYTDQKISTTALHGNCSPNFSGTSAAAPLAAGVVALALEANPDLTWRDVQHALVHTGCWEKLSKNPGWETNAKGLHFNMRFGFGLVDATNLVKAVKDWTNVSPQITQKVEVDPAFHRSMNLITIEEPLIVQFNYEEDTKIISLEHVQVITTLEHSCRGTLRITLTSPQGTNAVLLTLRKKDCSPRGITNWPFMSLKTWGEDPRGTWTLKIEDKSVKKQTGVLKKAILVLYGTEDIPEHLKSN